MAVDEEESVISRPLLPTESDAHDGHISSQYQYYLISQVVAEAGRAWRQGRVGTFYIAEIGIKFLRPIPPGQADARVELRLKSSNQGGVSRMAGRIATDVRLFTKFTLTTTWR